jgi:hypothetical protein
VNSVPSLLKPISWLYLPFTRRTAASLVDTAATLAKPIPAQPLRGTAAVSRPEQPAAQMSADAHWARVSAVVERSVVRANGISEQHVAARQQLDAAEYTLHRLIEELNEIMLSPVQLPKRAEPAAPQEAQGFVRAMAA